MLPENPSRPPRTFGTNETSKTVSVSTTDDSADEDDETFTLTLSSPANATLDDATATGTIVDDDETPAGVDGELRGGPSGSTTGRAGFTFELLQRSARRTLRDEAFNVGGGVVRKARRRQQGSNQAWDITVEPDSAGPRLTIELSKTVSGPAAALAPAARDPEDADQALVEDVTPEAAAAALLGEDPLSSAQLEALEWNGWTGSGTATEATTSATCSCGPSAGVRSGLRADGVRSLALAQSRRPRHAGGVPDPGFLRVELTSETAVRGHGDTGRGNDGTDCAGT